MTDAEAHGVPEISPVGLKQIQESLLAAARSSHA